MTDADLNPPLSSSVPNTFDPNAPAGGGSSRYTPTRPSSAVATALEPQAMPDVQPVATYTVQRGDSLWSLAKKNGITVRELASANGLRADAGLRLGQVLVVPGGAPVAASSGAMAGVAEPTSSRSYQIQPGDTLGKIAQRHGTTVAELKAFNRMSSDLLRAGDTLSIPESATVTPQAGGGETADLNRASVAVPSDAFKHTVAPGESLTVIASRYGVKIGEIALANKIRDPSLIRPGQELIIPGWQAPEETPAAPTPAVVEETVPASEASSDLDAGFGDDDLDNVPVITVEEPVKTIGGDNPDGPTVFE